MFDIDGQELDLFNQSWTHNNI